MGCGTGLKFDDGSDGSIRWAQIDSNTVGITTLNDAAPNLGGPCSTCPCTNAGSNQVTQSTNHHVVNLSTGVTLSAECNYWSPGMPKANKFIGSVDYNPYLTSPPEPPQGPGAIAGESGGDDDPGSRVPSSFALFPSHPNPFNPATTVRYDVPPPGGRVSMIVYDVSGRAVRVLVDTEMQPGSFAVDWDGRDDRRQPVASGVYFVRMISRDFERTQKLTLLK